MIQKFGAAQSPELSQFIDRKVKFINVKLPLGGFVLTSEYAHEQKLDEMKYNSETADFIETLAHIIPFSDPITDIYYKEGRIEVYFWNSEVVDTKGDPTECVAVKFEYATYEQFENKKKYKLSELKKTPSN